MCLHQKKTQMLEVMTLQIPVCNVIMRKHAMQCIEMFMHANECSHFGHKRVAKLTDVAPKKRSSSHIEPHLIFPCCVVELVLHVFILWVILMSSKMSPNHVKNNFAMMRVRSESILFTGL